MMGDCDGDDDDDDDDDASRYTWNSYSLAM